MKSIAIAAATAFVCIVGIRGVSAATGTTQNVNNVNDPVNHPYQENGYNACDSGLCSITFGTIAAPETVVQHVSCGFNAATGTVVEYAYVYDGTSANSNYLPMSHDASYNGNVIYIINESTQLFFTTGGQPVVEIVANNNLANLTCTISGYHR